MKNVDIKQLALFCELIESQSLTEAASRMNITPSAASQALTRLRNVLNDDLFKLTVLTPNGVVFTLKQGDKAHNEMIPVAIQ